MRKAWLLLVLAPSALFYACGGGDDSDGGSDANSDSTSDVSSKLDMGTTKDVVDAGPLLACHAPVDCVGGDPNKPHPPEEAGVVCCGELDLAGTAPNCDFIQFTSKCIAPAGCPSDIQIMCTTSIVRGCAFTAECTEPGYGLCCTVKAFADASVCMSQQIATTINAKCLP